MMAAPDKTTAKLLYFLGDNFRKLHPGVAEEDANWKKLLVLASKNRVLFLLSKELLKRKKGLPANIAATAEKVNDKGSDLIKKFDTTIMFLEKTASKLKLDILVIKTFKKAQDVVYDVDIVLKNQEDFNILLDYLKQFGKLAIKGKGKAEFNKPGLLEIDINTNLRFEKLDFFDQTFLWKGCKKKKGLFVPSATAELAVQAAHSFFERQALTLLDFFHIADLIKNNKINISELEKEARKYNWLGASKFVLAAVDSLHYLIYGKRILHHGAVAINNVKFPFFYPPGKVFASFIEKSADLKSNPARILSLTGAFLMFVRKTLRCTLVGRVPYHTDWFELKAAAN